MRNHEKDRKPQFKRNDANRGSPKVIVKVTHAQRLRGVTEIFQKFQNLKNFSKKLKNFGNC